MEGHLTRVLHAEVAWAGADAYPHIATTVVPRAREDALTLEHGSGCGGGLWRDEEACVGAGAPARVVAVDRAGRMDPGRVRAHGMLVGEGYGFREGGGAYALR